MKSKSKKSMNGSKEMSLSDIALQNEANKKECCLTYPVLQFRNDVIVAYEKSEYLSIINKEKLEENLKLAQLNYLSDISSSGQKRIRKLLEVWYLGIEKNNKNYLATQQGKFRKLVFVTLTLSSTQVHSDQEIKHKLLKPFLRIIRERFECENYLWKAETQGNGNIHFHLAIDQYLDKDVLQHVWNKCQENLGYITSFEKKYNHKNAPSTQIEVVKNQQYLSYYLAKYLSKNEKNRIVSGAKWKASKQVSTLNYFSCESDSYCEKAIYKSILERKCDKHESDFCTSYYFKGKSSTVVMSANCKLYYAYFLNILVNHLYSNESDLSFDQKIYNHNVQLSQVKRNSEVYLFSEPAKKKKDKDVVWTLFQSDSEFMNLYRKER